MKKIIIISLIALTAIFILIRHFAFSKETGTVKINGTEFQIEMAKTETQRRQGLSGRKNLCPSCGMLFAFSQAGNYPFTMHGMNFSLDIIWINNGKIVFISKNVPLEQQSINPNVKIDQVLELNAGTCDHLGIEIGDSVK
jgi:uncharacterized protein